MLGALLLLCAFAGPAGAEVVDRVEAVVEQQVVMTSDVAFDEVLLTLDASPSAFWTRPVGSPLERLIDVAVIRHLAGDVTVYQPSEEAVAERLEGLIRAHFASRGAWNTFLQTWGLDEAGMKGALRRRMVVERYLARNLASGSADTGAWWRACDTLLAEERSHLRLRVIPPRHTE